MPLADLTAWANLHAQHIAAALAGLAGGVHLPSGPVYAAYRRAGGALQAGASTSLRFTLRLLKGTVYAMTSYPKAIAAIITIGISAAKARTIDKSSADEATKVAQLTALLQGDLAAAATLIAAIPALNVSEEEAKADLDAIATPEMLAALVEGEQQLEHVVVPTPPPPSPPAAEVSGQDPPVGGDGSLAPVGDAVPPLGQEV